MLVNVNKILTILILLIPSILWSKPENNIIIQLQPAEIQVDISNQDELIIYNRRTKYDFELVQ